MSKGLFLLSEDGSQVRWFFLTTTNDATQVSEWWDSSSENLSHTYYASPTTTGAELDNYNALKFGSSITSLFDVPNTDDDTETFSVVWQSTTSNPIRYIKITIEHTSGNSYYTCIIQLLDENNSNLIYSRDFLLFCKDAAFQYMYVDYSYVYRTLTLFIAPLTNDLADSFMFGFLKGPRTSNGENLIYDIEIYRNGAGVKTTSSFFNYRGSDYPLSWYLGALKDTPSYPTGGVEPTDVFGGDEYNFDGSSDDIPVPDALTGALDNGFVKSYLISAQQLYQFMADITNFNSSSVTDFLNNVSLLFKNPIDAIISVKAFCLDFTQFPISNAENVYLLSFNTTAVGNPIYQQYYKLDIGSIDIDEYFGGFLDYPPYTRITIYLPFIGEQELNVQEVMGATIHLYYMIDFLTGNCVAHLNVEKTAGDSTINSDLYQWEGNMACDIPITGSDWHQVLGNFGKNAVLDLTSGLTANIGGVIDAFGGMMGATNTGTVLSGAISGSSALMGVRVPYIKIENAIQSMPDNFTELKGMRDGIQHTISELSGYASVMAVNIDNISATDDEKAILKSLLMEGIII